MLRAVLAIVLLTLPLSAAEPLSITVATGKPLHTFDPTAALGFTIDAHSAGESEEIFTKTNVDAIRSAGFHRLSYRVMTELACEAWHWNPAGSWSEPDNQQGYWTSSSQPGDPIELSYGYHLPRRGNTFDEAHQDGWSRIDDGDSATFWKSNPYLDEHFAGEPHPQWVLIDLGAFYAVDGARIEWSDPYATDFRFQYWTGSDAIHFPQETRWTDFVTGRVTGAHGGTSTVRLSKRAVRVRYLRLLMTRSSHTARSSSNDFRDRAGYAIRELSIGSFNGSHLVDRVRHLKNQRQTVIWVSSTDSWHRAIDRNPETEQLGFDAVFAKGLPGNGPMLTPVALLYGTPDDAAAEVAYLKKRGYPLTEIEMGEEPDGQQILPEDYAALYRQWARAIHAVEPSLRLGGPALQATFDTTPAWPDAAGNTSWIGRFVDDLRVHGQLADFNFFSFEWYPFDKLCQSQQEQIVRGPSILMPVLRSWIKGGLPQNIPWLVTEYGYSSWATTADVNLIGAMFDTEFVAQFLSVGGAGTYFYGVEPDVLISEPRSCGLWGNLLLFLSDEEHRIRYRLPTYWAARMLTSDWTMAAGGEHTIHETEVRPRTLLVTAYALHRPDGKWSVLLFNKNDRRMVRARVVLGTRSFAGTVDVAQYSEAQYAWKADGENGHPTRDLPPLHGKRPGSALVDLPPHSITVVTGMM